MNLHEQQELQTVLRRFGNLTTRAQLCAFEVIREYLGEEVRRSTPTERWTSAGRFLR